jgi:uncharacterized protein (TIGR03435 family)
MIQYMKRIFAVAALLASSLAGQTPAFEVASITPCKPGTPEPPGEHMGLVQFTYPGGRFRASATTLKFLLEWAYGIQPSQHAGGPAWLETDRYDIVAKAEGEASDEQMKLMAQMLLADRFRLKLHHESRSISAYVISAGKAAPKLSPAKDGETHSVRFAPRMSAGEKISSYHIIITRFSLSQLSDTFARQLGRPIVNQTGLDGEYDFELELTPDESRPSPTDPAFLLSALRDQLGLTVKSEKIPMDILVIDSADKVEAGN